MRETFLPRFDGPILSVSGPDHSRANDGRLQHETGRATEQTTTVARSAHVFIVLDGGRRRS